MKNALIGCTGFVGMTLNKQCDFTCSYHSTDISLIENETFDQVICAAAPAQKWYANLHPDEDLQNIKKLISHLETLKTDQFILISTVDVFKTPVCINENSRVITEGLHPYGLNRYYLEEYIRARFKHHLIVRLPGLVGAGLKKNILFDFKHNNQLQAINSEDIFQFYPMVNLWKDISFALKNNLSLVHLSAYPIQVKEIASKVFNLSFKNKLDRPTIRYDMRSLYAPLWGKELYQYDRRASLEAIRAYAESSEGER